MSLVKVEADILKRAARILRGHANQLDVGTPPNAYTHVEPLITEANELARRLDIEADKNQGEKR